MATAAELCETMSPEDLKSFTSTLLWSRVVRLKASGSQEAAALHDEIEALNLETDEKKEEHLDALTLRNNKKARDVVKLLVTSFKDENALISQIQMAHEIQRRQATTPSNGSPSSWEELQSRLPLLGRRG